MRTVAVSACLLGENCRYDGKSNANEQIRKLLNDPGIKVIPVCPECAGGLSVPRKPAEIKDGKTVTQDGEDVTAEFEKGARSEFEKLRKEGCQTAILKARSPSCGVGTVYDGTFSHTRIEGNGVFAALCLENGIKCITEEDFKGLF